jgi:hypothetical protein
MADCAAIIAAESPFLPHKVCANIVVDAYGFLTSNILDRVSCADLVTEARRLAACYRRALSVSAPTANPHKDHAFALFEEDGMLHILFTRFVPALDTRISFFQNSKGGIGVIVHCDATPLCMRFYCRSFDRTGRYPRAEGRLEPREVTQLFDTALDRFIASANGMGKYLLGESLHIADSDWSAFSASPDVCANPLRAFLED